MFHVKHCVPGPDSTQGDSMASQYVATVNGSKTTHGIRDGWSYDQISKARTGCGITGPFAVEHMMSGAPLAVTCKRSGCKGK